MKILLLSRYGHLGASSRVRSYQYLPYLKKNGFKVTVAPLLGDDYLKKLYSGEKPNFFQVGQSYLKRFFQLFNSKSYDLVWIEYELFPWLPAICESFLQFLNVSYIVDYDDAVFHKYDTHRYLFIRKLLKNKIDAVMRRAALVVVGNDYLASRARSAGAQRIEYLPTVIDLKRYDTHVREKNDAFTIGWIGTPMTAKYLNDIAPALAMMAEKRLVRLVAVGPQTLRLTGVSIEIRPWSESSEVENIKSFDVGIMPLNDSPWERGKCGYKLIQYMACGIPVVASSVGVNREIVEHGNNGFLASTHADWLNALLTLADDKRLARQMGGIGRAKVEKGYCLQVTAPKLAKLMHKAVGNIV